MKNEKITNQNQFKEVSNKIAKGTVYSAEQIEKLLRKYAKYIEIGINTYNIENDLITWYNIDNEIIVIFKGRELQGININKNKLLNETDCETILGVYEV